MNKNIRTLIREYIQESDLLEDYPASFDMEVFKSLKSHAGRNRYAQEHLQRLASGSSRIVYKIDDEKVLKLAKNDKGIAQNEVEIEHSNYSDLSDIVARTIDYDPNNLWVEMELARKMSKGDFKRITGFSFDLFARVLQKTAIQNNPGKYRGYHIPYVEPGVDEDMWEEPTISAIFSYVDGYDIPYGDLIRPSSYGIVKRNGQDEIVLVDYGLTEDVYDTHYKRR